jgi:hypothetical protein
MKKQVPVMSRQLLGLARRKSARFAGRLVLLAFLLAVPVLGCGQEVKGVKISGTVIPPDKIVLDEKDMLTVHIAAGEGDKGVGDAAQVGKDGSFTLLGPSKKGVPAGEYKVTVTANVYDHSPARVTIISDMKTSLSAFKGKLDVGSSDMTIVIDMKKKTITTK